MYLQLSHILSYCSRHMHFDQHFMSFLQCKVLHLHQNRISITTHYIRQILLYSCCDNMFLQYFFPCSFFLKIRIASSVPRHESLLELSHIHPKLYFHHHKYLVVKHWISCLRQWSVAIKYCGDLQCNSQCLSSLAPFIFGRPMTLWKHAIRLDSLSHYKGMLI